MNGGTSSCRLAGCLLLLLLLGPAAAQEKLDRIEPFKPIGSAALILTEKTQGSGVVIDRADRLVLTDHHVAAAGQAVEAIFPIWSDDGQVLINRDLYLRKGRRIKGRVVASSPADDLAVVQLDSIPSTVAEIKLASKACQAEDRVHLMGCPGNSDRIWVAGVGTVRAVNVKAPPESALKAQLMILTTPDRRMAAGASGGPAVNDQGELVGLIRSGALDSTYMVCIDAGTIRKFLGDYYRKLGSDALEKKEYNQAIAQCTKAVTVNPADALAFHERAAAHSFLHHFEDALADYSAAVKIDPTLPKSWRGRASVHYNLGNYSRAVADSSEAVKLDPGYALAYLSRSRAYEKMGQTDLARADRETAVKLDPRLK